MNTSNVLSILEKSLTDARITDQEALTLLKDGGLLELGQTADRIRKKKHPHNYVTFIIDRNINYTNICRSKCEFCAFYREKDSQEAYVLDKETIFTKIEEAISAGGTQIMLQGGLNADLKLAYFEELLRGIKEKFKITVHSFSPAEIIHLAGQENLSVKEVLIKLRQAGLDSLPGGGAEILDDKVRSRVSPSKIKAQEWLEVMEIAHKLGISSTATMVIGLGESLEERVNHFRAIRELQDRTRGFRAFIMWTFQPGNTKLQNLFKISKTTSWDYLHTLATARIYLDNIEHLQGSWVTQGESVGQLTLTFGANDLGSIMLEENVVRATGIAYEMSVRKITDIISATGKIAAQRDTAYDIIKILED